MTSRVIRTLSTLLMMLGVLGATLAVNPSAASAGPRDWCSHPTYGGTWYCGYDYEFYHFDNGVTQIFVVGPGWNVYTRWKRTNGTFSSWVNMGGEVRHTYLATDLRFVWECSNQPIVEVIGTNGRVYGKGRNADGSWDPNWVLDSYFCPPGGR